MSLGLPVGPLDPAEQLVMASWGVKLPTSVAAAPKLEALNSDELTSLGGGNSFNGYKQVYGHAMDDVTSRGDGDGDRGSDSRAMQHVRDSNLLPSSWTIELDASLAYAMGLKKDGGGTGGLVISMDQASERIIQALQIQAGSLMRRNWQLVSPKPSLFEVTVMLITSAVPTVSDTTIVSLFSEYSGRILSIFLSTSNVEITSSWDVVRQRGGVCKKHSIIAADCFETDSTIDGVLDQSVGYLHLSAVLSMPMVPKTPLTQRSDSHKPYDVCPSPQDVSTESFRADLSVSGLNSMHVTPYHVSDCMQAAWFITVATLVFASQSWHQLSDSCPTKKQGMAWNSPCILQSGFE